ncbi:MAG: hypothetical protein M1826_001819 [Phylliscum demangeonii]|nr:MAG: hypothetical protein M1826_001819 [Phylliscum demangeonii]
MTAEAEDPTAPVQPMKFSRYRSVRRGAAPPTVAAPPLPPLSPLAATPVGHTLGSARGARRPADPLPTPAPTPLVHRHAAAQADRRPVKEQPEQERRGREREEFLQRQRRRELERLEKELSQAVPAPPPAPPSPKNALSAAFLSRKRSPTVGARPSDSNHHRTPGPKHTRGGSADRSKTGPKTGPGADAPISAVNAGERRVKIHCRDTTVTLPVLPTTTAGELTRAATHYLSGTIVLETSVLLESFAPLGLERRIRKYEHVRAILNSWGQDTQNQLILAPSTAHEPDLDLEARCAPQQRPADTTVSIYHSQKPGKWKKRWVTLCSNGQVVMAKKQPARPKEVVPLCHVSDYDIYTVTPRQQAKVLKPPRKHCFAVKSQEKSSIFLDTENFVHFFATEDPSIASQWYQAVQEWRSWYLVDRMGGGRPGDGGGAAGVPPVEVSSATRHAAGHRPSHSAHDATGPSAAAGASATTTTTTTTTATKLAPLLGQEFQYATNIVSRDFPVGPAEVKHSTALHARNLSSRLPHPPPVSFPATMNGLSSTSSVRPREHSPAHHRPDSAHHATPETAVFASTGRLGRTHSLRPKAPHEREVPPRSDLPLPPSSPGVAPPPTEPGRASAVTIAPRPLGRSQSIRSATSGAGFGRPGFRPRTATLCPHQKPLLDFSTPEFREAPQHARKGRGFVPTQPLTGGLVAAATSPGTAIALPPSTSLRRPPPPPLPLPMGTETRQMDGSGHPSPRTDRFRPRTADGGGGSSACSVGRPPSATAPAPAAAARPVSRRGTVATGQGVRTGDRLAIAPMLDLRQPSQFIPGSLLARAELGGAAAPRSLDHRCRGSGGGGG